MTEVDDGYDSYDSYYAERLWQLLPAVYRTADTDSFTAPGPLRELLNRIGAQVAVVRRSIDRLWADQAIETCDDWVIPYIGDLLGTSLAGNLDARAHRLDVAKTISYRRRKGTLQVLEELALDVTGWTAHIVEGFRRLARTRHGLDPAIGPAAFPQAGAADVARLLRVEGLTGRAGGFADLRSAHGAALANTAFDESFHTADVRAGRGAAGHFGIPVLLVFLWRLTSFPVVAGTPVAVAGHAGQYVFDPTGRQIPLFLPPAPDLGDFSGPRASVREWQVPGPLTSSLETALTDTRTSPPPVRPAYPANPTAYPGAGIPARYGLGGNWQLASIRPEAGRFAATPASPAEPLTVDYQYGFSSTVGAGPYDRGLLGNPPAVAGTETTVTGGTGLDAQLTAAGTTGTVTIGDSRTYVTLASAGSSAAPIVSLLVRAGRGMRPVLRPATRAAPWVFTGGGEARLVLDGLTVSGCDIVLRGSFDTVRMTGCTVDPGTAGPGSPPLAVAADGVPLAPGRIFVEADPAAPAGEGGTIRRLLVDHCILGPVRTRFAGAVETVTITDSIVQGLAATTGAAVTAADVFDPSLLATNLLAPGPLSEALLTAIPGRIAAALRAYGARALAGQEPGLPRGVLTGLNALVDGPSLYDADLFANVNLSPDLLALAAEAGTLDPAGLATLNRGLLTEAFPVALGVAALAVADATVQLTRVTVLGRIAAHRLAASDSVLTDFTAINNVQDGFVRFSAYAAGSAIPRPYQSAPITPGAPIFTSSSYGQPGYAQLLETADAAITGGATGVSISSGAGTRSEMGAFSADRNPLKEQGLLVKYAEYMPLGLTPVIVHVT